MKKLTKSDEENLRVRPMGKWFREIDVCPKVRRTKYSLNRLYEAGALKRKQLKSGLEFMYFKDQKGAAADE